MKTDGISMKLISVIISGGGGTRLWPVSRQELPKPFMHLGASTLLQQAVERGQSCGALETLIVTNQDYLELTLDVLSGLNDPPYARFLLEPKGRNTAPAIAQAALACEAAYGPESIMLVLPADHLIPDTSAFVACALEAARLAETGQLVVFGIAPSGPETAFGYIEVEQVSRFAQNALCFVEKPDHVTAERYLATGRYYWNSGMFCFSAGAFLAALKLSAPEVLVAAQNAWARREVEGSVCRFEAHTFGLQPNISVDYAVMERAANVMLVPARFGWSDVGSWPAVAQAHTVDSAGNTVADGRNLECVMVDTHRTHVQVQSHGSKVVATIGLQDILIVDTPDALLVAHRDFAQKVKNVVDILKSRGHPSALHTAVTYEPWGAHVALRDEDGYKVRRIAVKPGRVADFRHDSGSVHWSVVQGFALVQLVGNKFKTWPGQHFTVGLKDVCHVTNTGQDELVLIEVQCADEPGDGSAAWHS
jgi:mannose-1-phosphate guanylyltransferase / mannose-6-phosphate isomerase